MGKDNRKLSGLLIDSNYQGKFLAVFGSIAVMQTALFYYAIHFIFAQVHTSAENFDLIQGTAFLSELDDLKCNMFLFFGIFFSIVMLLFLALGFRFTHKTAGAMFKIKKELAIMEEKGQLHKIVLRDGDFFRDVEESFNKVVDKIK